MSLDPSADGVSYAPVHRVSLDPNQQTEQCAVALDEARRIAANIAKLQDVGRACVSGVSSFPL
jgi:hypothetical protein